MMITTSTTSSNKEPFLIGVAGGISSGKSSVCKKIIEELSKLNDSHPKHVLVLSLDSFYKELSADELAKAERGELNLDHPEAYDDKRAYQTLMDLMNGKQVKIRSYDKKHYKLVDTSFVDVPAGSRHDVIIIEGILTFYYPNIRDLCQMKLFVDSDADTRLSRRVMRDLQEYKRPLDHILNYYQKFVKPAFEEFCLPTKKYADVIIPRGADNMVAINLIVQHLNDFLNNSHEMNQQQQQQENGNSSSSSSLSSMANNNNNSSSGIDLQRNGSSSSLNSRTMTTTTTPSKRSDPSSRPH